MLSFNPTSLSGVVYVGGIPNTAATKVLDPPPEPMLGPIIQNTNVTLGLAGGAAWIDMSFNDASAVPWWYYVALLGSSASVPPAVIEKVAGRVQDATALKTVGATGLPALVIHGTRDKLVNNAAVAEVVRENFKNTEVWNIEGGSHTVFWEHESQFVDALSRFAKKVRPWTVDDDSCWQPCGLLTQ